MKRSVVLFQSMAAAMAGLARTRGNTINIIPKHYDSVVVITHGLGDTAEGFRDVAEMFSQRMPTTKFILPTAPTQPVTLNGGMSMPSWYDIEGLDDRAAEDCKGIDESAATIKDLLKNEFENEKIPYKKMVLAGFSQGGALSLFTGMQLESSQQLAGVVVMSGYLAGAKRFKITPGLEATPILHCHGTADPMVPFSGAQRTKEALIAGGASQYKLQPFQGMPHTVTNQELGLVFEFIQSVLSKKTEAELEDVKTTLGDQAVGLLNKQKKDEL